jgi:hypothetical protein
MASIWQEYLQDLLGGSLKSERNRLLRQEIEKAAGYADTYRTWNDMPPEERAEAWRRLIQAARTRAEVSRGVCLRCGECCQNSSPSLLLADLPLLQQEKLTWNEVYTLRPGEQEIPQQGPPCYPGTGAPENTGSAGQPAVLFFSGGHPFLPHLRPPPGAVPPPYLLGRSAAPAGPGGIPHPGAPVRPGAGNLGADQAHEERCNLFRLRENLEEVAAGAGRSRRGRVRGPALRPLSEKDAEGGVGLTKENH